MQLFHESSHQLVLGVAVADEAGMSDRMGGQTQCSAPNRLPTPCRIEITAFPSPESMTQKHTRVVAIYPGSFDPITNGHLDVIERGSRLFDRLIVSVLQNEAKSPLFSVQERMEMLAETVSPFKNVEVDSFHGLLADYALKKNAGVILRGIRAISDYENELQMALMNRRLQPGLETAFLLAGEAFSFISSRLVKEVIGLGGNITGLVPPLVEQRLRERFKTT
jgi:pantetheine-phosphate adenylyltransferase